MRYLEDIDWEAESRSLEGQRQGRIVTMSSLCAACEVDVPDFTDASDLTGTEFRELGMSLANQLPSEALTALLPDHWDPGG